MKKLLTLTKLGILISVLSPLIIFANAQAASITDCSGHANASECKAEIQQAQCSAKPDKAAQQCIQDILSKYPTTGYGTDKVDNCPTNQSNAFNPSGSCVTALPQVAGSQDEVKNGLAIVFGVGAAVSLVSIMIAAFNFVTAATDSEKISRAKKTILFSLIGLVITLSAEAIVLTVVDHL